MKKLYIVMTAFLMLIMIAVMLHTPLTIQGNTDFKTFNVDTKGGTAKIGNTSYTFLKSGNGIRAFGNKSLSSTAVSQPYAKSLAVSYKEFLNDAERAMIQSSQLPSYQDFSNVHDPNNSQLLRSDVARGSSNWWLSDTQKIQLPYEVDQPGNAVYASRIVAQGKKIENSTSATSFAYKGFDASITNYHSVGIKSANFTVPVNYSLNKNYTLGGRNYDYKDTNVTFVAQKSPPPGYTTAFRSQYSYREYDFAKYGSLNGPPNEQVTIRKTANESGGQAIRFWDLMNYNKGRVAVIAELGKDKVTKITSGRDAGRLRVEPSQYFSIYSSGSKSEMTLQGGKSYVLYLPVGFSGGYGATSSVIIDVSPGVNIPLKTVRGNEYGSWIAYEKFPVILAYDYHGFESYATGYGDKSFKKGTPADPSHIVKLYSGADLVYVGPVSNILTNGNLMVYGETPYVTRSIRNLYDFGATGVSWGYRAVYTTPSEKKGIITIAGTSFSGISSGNTNVYIEKSIVNPQLNINIKPGFYRITVLDRNKPLNLQTTFTGDSVLNRMKDAYVRKNRGENIATPIYTYYDNVDYRGCIDRPKEYAINEGLTPGTFSIPEYLPTTFLSGQNALAYPMVTPKTEKIAYTAKTNEQTKMQPILKETANTIVNQGESQVLFAFTNKLSWQQNRIHLINHDIMTKVDANGRTLHVQGGTKQVKFKVSGISDTIASNHTLYVSAASETKDGKKVYGRIGTVGNKGIATIDIENLMDYKTSGTTKQVRLYIEAVTTGDEMNYVSDTSLPVTLDITEPNHMTISFPTYVELDQGKADVNLSVVDYVFHEENVPRSFVPKLETTIPTEAGQARNTLKVQDTKGKADLNLKIQPPDTTVLQGNEIGIGKVITYKLLGDGTQGSDKLSNGMWKGMLKIHVDMSLYP